MWCFVYLPHRDARDDSMSQVAESGFSAVLFCRLIIDKRFNAIPMASYATSSCIFLSIDIFYENSTLSLMSFLQYTLPNMKNLSLYITPLPLSLQPQTKLLYQPTLASCFT